MIMILILLILFAMLFSGLALFLSKLFVIGLLLLPIVALISFFVMWRNMRTT
ncbi:MAG TPA: hypothetical protein VG845_00935 [Dehalococcoidia bacterium]|jgi:hypothetical protein|nr:hypothetical protein [Dehalococcoidia bacterium]